MLNCKTDEWCERKADCRRTGTAVGHILRPQKKTIELLFLDMCFVVFIEDQVTKVQLTKKVDVR